MAETNIYHGEGGEKSFELLDAVNRQGARSKIYISLLMVFCGLEFFGVIYLATKPPLVIRIDKLGNSEAISDYTFETKAVTDQDLKDFSQRFLDDYVGLKSNTVVDQLKTSLNMMTPDFAKIHLDAMTKENTIAQVQAANVRNDIVIESLTHEDGGDYIYVTLKGNLLTRPLDRLGDSPTAKPLKADLVLTRTKRTPDHPYALLLHDIQIGINQEAKRVGKGMSEVLGE